uniref:ATP synthase complex subunit 8 n=1 Tax=Ptiliidae sp. BMNH 1274726 TaxID=1796538 RepID=A0A126TEI1_9COLE|nr:ATP synthase F0 subunit 8 [Ptiliidae sp. BMNH 1274726]
MPQMMPLNWIMLFTYFILLFFIMNSLNYYNSVKNIKTNKIDTTKNKINWKW